MQRAVISMMLSIKNQDVSVEVFATIANIIHKDNIVNIVSRSSTKIQMKTSKAHMCVNVSAKYIAVDDEPHD